MKNIFGVVCKGSLILIYISVWMVGNHGLTGQNNCVVNLASETLNLPAVPPNLDVEKTYIQTSELFFTMPEGASLADINSYDLLYLEPVKEVDRYVYAKDPSGNEIVLKHALNPEERFKPSVEPYELMVLYHNYIEIFNRNSTRIFASELTTPEDNGELGGGGELDGGGELGGSGSPDGGGTVGSSPGDSIQIIPISGDSIYQIIGPNFEVYVNKATGLVFETVFDDFGVWVEKDITFYNPLEPNRTRPVVEMRILRDTLPISGDCIFKVIANKYEDYCSNETSDGSNLRLVNPTDPTTDFSIKQWPNPASNFLTVEIESGITDPDFMASIEIINLEGKVVFSEKSPANQARIIDVSSFPTGLYVLTAKAGEQYAVERLLIQR